MNNYQEFKIFLYLGLKEITVTVFDDKDDQIYQDIFIKEKDLYETNEVILNTFLDRNIYKIEKLINIFVKEINLVIDTDLFKSISISTKRKSFGKKITFYEMKQMLFEIREEIKKDNVDETIIHMLIKNYFANGQKLNYLDKELNCDNLIIEVEFICLSNHFINELNKKFKHYQVEINKIISANYVRNFNSNSKLSINQAAFKVLKGENFNEVLIVPKNTNKMGFFEKFFYLFS